MLKPLFWQDPKDANRHVLWWPFWQSMMHYPKSVTDAGTISLLRPAWGRPFL